ncbi:hypothetical protein ALC62_11469 [Cyphomyrmex costatus]|uniref:Uncharacterized protein n=1 Tax=Cyphomyrmex costatus TaxID=456900 RepID=A0A151ICN4_9HYME|nr:hypothetical protein ALC62_11469 [Cyphomyrmex costatus]
MDVDEDVMNVEPSNDSVLSVDTGCVSDLENDRVRKIIPDAQILGVFRVKRSSATRRSASAVCMVDIAEVGSMIRKHDTDFIEILSTGTCSKCHKLMCLLFPCCPICTA